MRGVAAPPPKKSLSRQDVEQRAAEIERQTHFEVLGVDATTPTGAIQSSYFSLAKLWHPDRTPPDLQDLKPTVQRVFARISEAFQTLSDPGKRAAYLETLKLGGVVAEQELVEKGLGAVEYFERAEVFMKRGQIAQAELAARKSVELDPQPHHQALLAWIQAHQLGEPPVLAAGQKTEMYLTQIRLLDVALAQSPNYDKALFYRAELYKRSGMVEQAVKDYKRVVALKPNHIDAAREVRLFEMRQTKQAQTSSSGLLGKLFKKE